MPILCILCSHVFLRINLQKNYFKVNKKADAGTKHLDLMFSEYMWMLFYKYIYVVIYIYICSCNCVLQIPHSVRHSNNFAILYVRILGQHYE